MRTTAVMTSSSRRISARLCWTMVFVRVQYSGQVGCFQISIYLLVIYGECQGVSTAPGMFRSVTAETDLGQWSWSSLSEVSAGSVSAASALVDAHVIVLAGQQCRRAT